MALGQFLSIIWLFTGDYFFFFFFGCGDHLIKYYDQDIFSRLLKQ